MRLYSLFLFLSLYCPKLICTQIPLFGPFDMYRYHSANESTAEAIDEKSIIAFRSREVFLSLLLILSFAYHDDNVQR